MTQEQLTEMVNLINAEETIDNLNREAAEWRERAEKAERELDEALAAGKLLVEANTLHFDRAEKAERERDEARENLKQKTDSLNAEIRVHIKTHADNTALRAIIARAVEAVEPFEKHAELIDLLKIEDSRLFGNSVASLNEGRLLRARDFRRLAALAADLRKADAKA